MSLTLSYHAKTSVPVEIEGVIPDRLRDKSLAEIERLEVYHGNRKLPLAELFSRLGRSEPTGESTSRGTWPASTSSATA